MTVKRVIFSSMASLVLLLGVLGCSDSETHINGGKERAEKATQKAMAHYAEGQHEMALLELKRAVTYDYAPAQYAMGVMYERGHGIEADFKQALFWYEKSAQQNYAYAQRNIAVLYEDGLGVTRDVKQALSWYEKAAAQQDKLAIEALQRLNQSQADTPQ